MWLGAISEVEHETNGSFSGIMWKGHKQEARSLGRNECHGPVVTGSGLMQSQSSAQIGFCCKTCDVTLLLVFRILESCVYSKLVFFGACEPFALGACNQGGLHWPSLHIHVFYQTRHVPTVVL